MTVLCPGASDTEFFERAHAEDTRIFQDTPLSEPEEVAQAGYEALMEGKRQVGAGADEQDPGGSQQPGARQPTGCGHGKDDGGEKVRRNRHKM